MTVAGWNPRRPLMRLISSTWGRPETGSCRTAYLCKVCANSWVARYTVGRRGDLAVHTNRSDNDVASGGAVTTHMWRTFR